MDLSAYSHRSRGGVDLIHKANAARRRWIASTEAVVDDVLKIVSSTAFAILAAVHWKRVAVVHGAVHRVEVAAAWYVRVPGKKR